MFGDVTSTPDALVGQASRTTLIYMKDAIESIDRQFETGYAKSHPELIATFMKTAAADFATAIFAQNMQRLAAAIETHSGHEFG